MKPIVFSGMAGNAALVRARQALFGKFVAEVHKSGKPRDIPDPFPWRRSVLRFMLPIVAGKCFTWRRADNLPPGLAQRLIYALLLYTGPGDGMTNMLATFFTFGCFGGAGFAVFSLMGNGKKIEGCVRIFLCARLRKYAVVNYSDRCLHSFFSLDGSAYRRTEALGCGASTKYHTQGSLLGTGALPGCQAFCCA